MYHLADPDIYSKDKVPARAPFLFLLISSYSVFIDKIRKKMKDMSRPFGG